MGSSKEFGGSGVGKAQRLLGYKLKVARALGEFTTLRIRGRASRVEKIRNAEITVIVILFILTSIH